MIKKDTKTNLKAPSTTLITTDKVNNKPLIQINFPPQFKYDDTTPVHDSDLSIVLQSEYIRSFETP